MLELEIKALFGLSENERKEKKIGKKVFSIIWFGRKFKVMQGK